QTLNRQVGAQIVSDADAQAYIDRVYTAGGTLTNTEANAVNQLVIDMKAAGIWTAMKAVYPMVGSSAAACAQNLKSSSFTGTFTSGWTFASTGATPNGTSAYMNSGLLPSTSLTNNSTHLSYYSRSTASANTGIELGAAVNSNSLPLIQLACNYTGFGTLHDQYSYINGRLTISTPNSFGFFCGSRTSSTSLKGYKNGSLVGTLSTTSTDNVTSINRFIALGAVNTFLGGIVAFSNRECAFASIGDGLTDTQAADFYTCVQTFNTTLSRQIAP
ncbi:hypothetical protein EBT25_12475, partial [bacterium]|nr:hypothetical protein [bacterium]